MSTIIPHPDSFKASLGGVVRRLRRARGLTLEGAAQAAGVGRVTLTRWENGTQRPRLRELEALLTALGAGSGERRQALALLDTPESHALVREEIARVGERLGLGPQPGGGDLLRAMRRRRGLSSDETAVRVGVTARTLRRWERGEAWPQTARLHALCLVLGAREAEVVALTIGDFAGATSVYDPNPTIEQISHDLRRVGNRVQLGEELLVELRFLTLESQAWRLAVQGEAGLGVLRQTLYAHALGLGNRGDDEASRRSAERVFHLGPGMDPRHPDASWIQSSAMVASDLIETSPADGARIAWEILKPLPDLTRVNSLKAWILSAMADCLVAQGAVEAALALGADSCRVAERSGNTGIWDQCHWNQSKRLLRLSRPAEALTVLDGRWPNSPLFALGFALTRTEALLELGETTDAEEGLREIYASIETYDLVHMRDKADPLAARLAA